MHRDQRRSGWIRKRTHCMNKLIWHHSEDNANLRPHNFSPRYSCLCLSCRHFVGDKLHLWFNNWLDLEGHAKEFEYYSVSIQNDHR